MGSVAIAKESHGVVAQNAGASLVDLGDGVGCIEFHSRDEHHWRGHGLFFLLFLCRLDTTDTVS